MTCAQARRHPKPFHLFGLERARPAELANASQHAVKLTQDEDRTLHTLRLPASRGFQSRQDLVEAVAQVGQNVIAIHAHAMSRMDGRCRAADQNGAGHKTLEMALGRQQAFPIG